MAIYYPQTDFDLKAKLLRMEKMRQEKPAYRALLGFYEKVYIEKEKCYQSLKLRFLTLDEHLIHIKVKEGFPILDKDAVTVDLEALERFFGTLLRLSREKSPDAAAQLSNHLQEKNTDVGELIREVWKGKLETEHWKKEEMGDPTLLFFLLMECLKPVYEYCARILQRTMRKEFWKQGYCPICGELPSIAEISAERESKLLFCVYCGTQWSFPLFMCPFCGNEEEEGIKSLYVEPEKQYRIDVCKHCDKYMKVVDAQALGHQVPLDVENIVTLHLDILAQKQGYQRGGKLHLLI